MEKITTGRYESEQGYIRVKVAKDHPAAFQGQYWAYEHIVVAMEKIGRPLMANEVVHHINGNKADNRPENLFVTTQRVHNYLHRKNNCGLRKPNEENPEIECACGCGEKLLKYDDIGRPRTRIYGHWDNLWETPTRDLVLEILSTGPKSAKEINNIFGRDIYSSLCYFLKTGLIKRVDHGIYSLP